MAGDWIKIMVSTPDKPEVFAIADKLGIDPDAVLGKLIRIWIWADQQVESRNANVTLGALRDRHASVTRSLFDRLAQMPGFTDALVSVGWLVADGDNVYFPNFDRHNGNSAKTRALGVQRSQKHRDKVDGRDANVTLPALRNRHATVTKASPEKRREELNTETTDVVSSTVPESQEPVVFAAAEYPLAGGKQGKIEQRHLDRWIATYRDRVDVAHELAKAASWLDANAGKRPRHTRGLVKFLANWLSKSDERERRNARGSPAAQAPAKARIPTLREALGATDGRR